MYVIGGIEINVRFGIIIRKYENLVECWNFDINIWIFLERMNESRSIFGVVVFVGEFYVLGGYDG